MKKQHFTFLFIAFLIVFLAGITMTRCNPLGTDPVAEIAASQNPEFIPQTCGNAQEYVLVDQQDLRYGKVTVGNSDEFIFVKAHVNREYFIEKMELGYGYDPSNPHLQPKMRISEPNDQSQELTLEIQLYPGQFSVYAKEFMSLTLTLQPANRDGRPIIVFVPGNNVEVGDQQVFAYDLQACPEKKSNIGDENFTDRPDPNPGNTEMIICGERNAFNLTATEKMHQSKTYGSATFMNSREELAVKIVIDPKWKIHNAVLYYGYDIDNPVKTEKPMIAKAEPFGSQTELVIKIPRFDANLSLDSKQYFALNVNISLGEKDMLPNQIELFVEGEYDVNGKKVFSYWFSPCTGGTQLDTGQSAL